MYGPGIARYSSGATARPHSHLGWLGWTLKDGCGWWHLEEGDRTGSPPGMGDGVTGVTRRKAEHEGKPLGRFDETRSG